jgi:hypothetical protein
MVAAKKYRAFSWDLTFTCRVLAPLVTGCKAGSSGHAERTENSHLAFEWPLKTAPCNLSLTPPANMAVTINLLGLGLVL